MPRLRPIKKMNTFSTCKFLVELLSEEWRKWCYNLRKLYQHIVKRTIGVIFISIITRLPEASSTPAYVPVACIFDKRQDRIDRIWNVVDIHMLLNLMIQLMNSTDDPLIKWVFELLTWVGKVPCKFPAINFSVHSKEVVHIPYHAELARDVTNILVLQRKILAIWNIYDFFTMYAEVDGWE